LSVTNIPKIIYAPKKAFKEIIQNPKYFGPILIMILFIAAYSGFNYVTASKLYDEQVLPDPSEGDMWTENDAFWTSNADVSESSDAVSGGFYGNKSIEFAITNNTQIYMQLDDIGSINCSSPEGYQNISFRLKLDYQETIPENATVHLISGQSGSFYRNWTDDFISLNKTIWNNLTIAIGPESNGWIENGINADWSSITGLRFEFAWSENANITVLVDGLFFRGVFAPVVKDITSVMLNFVLSSFMQFTIRWVFLSLILFLVIRAFGLKTVWRPVLILVGFILITIVIQAVISAIAFSTLPTIYRPLELFGGTEAEFSVAFDKLMNTIWLVNQIYGYLQIVIFMWTIGLCAIAVRVLTEFAWTKSILIATVAYFASMLIQSFFGV